MICVILDYVNYLEDNFLTNIFLYHLKIKQHVIICHIYTNIYSFFLNNLFIK